MFQLRPLRQQRRADEISFVDTRLLRFCASLVVRLAASFRGTSAVLSDCWSEDAAAPCLMRKDLFTAWLAWRSLEVLEARGCLGLLQDVGFRIGRNTRDAEWRWLAPLGPVLRRSRVAAYVREHTCEFCQAVPVVACDAKVSISAAWCARLAVCELEFPNTGLSVRRGCSARVRAGSRFCASHVCDVASCRADGDGGAGLRRRRRVSDLAGGRSSLTASAGSPCHILRMCPGEHALVWIEDVSAAVCCSDCLQPLSAGDSSWLCDLCDYFVCEGCAAGEPDPCSSGQTTEAVLDVSGGVPGQEPRPSPPKRMSIRAGL